MATQPVGEVIDPRDDEEEIVSGGSLSAIEEADRSHQVATAKKFPRSITRFRQELTEIARASQPVAMEMMYSLPRAGNQLVGPSIRFAEAVLSCWGNSRAGVEVVEVNTDDAFVVAEGRFYDCEKNVGIAIRTRRRNVTKKKDGDSYQVTGAAASSLALRNAILRGVPKALWADIFEQAKMTAAGTAESIAKTRSEMLKLFTALGITEARIYAALGVAGQADLGTEEIVAMKAWHRQLINKESKIEDIFGNREDTEIDEFMDALNWNETTRRMARKNFAGRPAELLEHVRAEAARAGIQVVAKAQASPNEPKEADTAKGDGASPAAETTSAKTAEDKSSQTSTPQSASVASSGTTGAASTSRASNASAKPKW
jgi:hypothetical protein